MRNRYPGVCYRCGEAVAAGEGHFQKRAGAASGPRWKLQHATCAIAYRGTGVRGTVKRPADKPEALAINRALTGKTH